MFHTNRACSQCLSMMPACSLVGYMRNLAMAPLWPYSCLMIKLNLRLPEDLHTRLTARATADRRSLNAEILHFIEVCLGTAPSGTPNRPDGVSTTPAPQRGSGHSPRP
ncbi:Arc family DNA-binding protein [Streptomyces sp. NPDC047043]|uniref:Arc family DNA-binding protein n=1 Tax=Streptomyces sp. NPDC047043 TaxID=3154497 RepID=UPI0033E10B4C